MDLEFSWILDCLISLIDQDSRLLPDSWILVGFSQGLESIGFSSDVGFWFFFGLSSFDLGLVLLRTFGSESLIDHTYSTTQTYNPP